jgi:hypothetical protein
MYLHSSLNPFTGTSYIIKNVKLSHYAMQEPRERRDVAPTHS